MLQGTQLFQLFGLFQRRRRPGRQIAARNPAGRRKSPDVNNRPRLPDWSVRGDTESGSAKSKSPGHSDPSRTFTRFGSLRSASAGNSVAAVAMSSPPDRCSPAADQAVDNLRLNLRLIALHVDDDIDHPPPDRAPPRRCDPCRSDGSARSSRSASQTAAAPRRSADHPSPRSLPAPRAHKSARSTTCWTSGFPVSEARILAGKRVEPKRAGMTTVAAKADPLFTQIGASGPTFNCRANLPAMPGGVKFPAAIQPTLGGAGRIARSRKGRKVSKEEIEFFLSHSGSLCLYAQVFRSSASRAISAATMLPTI